MANGSPNFERRQKALQAVRRHVRRLEIETHRVKAHLARLEAEYEEDVADWMTRKLRRRSSIAHRVDQSHADSVPEPIAASTPVAFPGAAPSNGAATTRGGSDSPPAVRTAAAKSRSMRESQPGISQFNFSAEPRHVGAHPRKSQTSRTYRQSTRPLLLSLAVHAVGLVLCTTFGFVTLVQQEARLFASPMELVDESPEEFAEVKIESAKFEEAELQNVLSETDDFNITANALQEFEPSVLGAGVQELGDIGQLDALPSELGELMAGAGSPGSGRPGGDLGDAVFFGTRSQGNRFVYVVDNSSSMKGGRLEAAIAELVRSVDALSPRQAFYVIFVSDQTYPMFYPQAATDLLPATAPNKKRLAAWLPKAILASGRNRELIKAIDLAASLRPDAVYLLWDGDMRYSEKVRLEVMTHLTRPNQWSFRIHTLGMGITSLDSEQNLTAIALANGGTYRRVDVPANRGR